MKNFEKYEREIGEFYKYNDDKIACRKVDMKFVTCGSLAKCDSCIWDGEDGCEQTMLKWFLSEANAAPLNERIDVSDLETFLTT